MAIDFTKPIKNFHTEEIVNVLYRDENGIYFEYKNSDFVRMHCTIDEFNKMFQNIPEEPKKIKGFIGVFTNGDSTIMKQTVEELKKHYFNTYVDFIAIVEINATEGEGLQ
jgi:hypothetical protein